MTGTLLLPAFLSSIKNDQVPDIETRNPFEIHSLDWSSRQTWKDMTRLTNYEIIYIRKGSGLISLNVRDFEIENHHVYFLWPGQLRTIKMDSSVEGYYVSLSLDFFYAAGIDLNFSFLSLRFYQADAPLIISTSDEIQQMDELLNMIKKEFACSLSLRFEIIKGLLKVFLLYLSRKVPVNECVNFSNCDRMLVTKFLSLLSQNFATKKMVTDYASELCVTRSYLNQVIKKVTGTTASQYIQQYVVMEAKRQAMRSNRSMKEIAYDLGFDDIAHFSKFFKSNSGMNFSSFKKEMFRVQC